MHQAFKVGKGEKHRVDFEVHWLFGFCVIKVDRKSVFRRPVFLKFEHSFEVGTSERHLVSLRYNPYDPDRNTFYASIDGQPLLPEMEIREGKDELQTPADDAAAALLFLVLTNVVFSVIGTLFVPELDSLEVRLTLLLGACVYLLCAVKTLSRRKSGLLLGTLLFTLDSACGLYLEFSWGGLFVRLIILYYLLTGLYYWRITEMGHATARA
ncbi:MAG TPA: hypothetical protein VL688_00580 [Verrucomicrobiae bacterium]|jgi:hypothetical protein|nr:hypothetical protein [Verrucomicrobiae bacterium]